MNYIPQQAILMLAKAFGEKKKNPNAERELLRRHAEWKKKKGLWGCGIIKNI